eukprot:c17929_g2_i1.p1 GENE.c17929_g2_i1~~c17929_g2_i1.p1  ORF type:complete len:342 (+),score=73.53 c17929_g2_i1:111-1028(+)
MSEDDSTEVQRLRFMKQTTQTIQDMIDQMLKGIKMYTEALVTLGDLLSDFYTSNDRYAEVSRAFTRLATSTEFECRRAFEAQIAQAKKPLNEYLGDYEQTKDMLKARDQCAADCEYYEVKLASLGANPVKHMEVSGRLGKARKKLQEIEGQARAALDSLEEKETALNEPLACVMAAAVNFTLSTNEATQPTLQLLSQSPVTEVHLYPHCPYRYFTHRSASSVTVAKHHDALVERENTKGPLRQFVMPLFDEIHEMFAPPTARSNSVASNRSNSINGTSAGGPPRPRPEQSQWSKQRTQMPRVMWL